MALLAFMFAATWAVSTGMAAHPPRLLEAAGASASGALAAAALVGPAQVAARPAEFGLMRRLHPLASARIATVPHPSGAAAAVLLGGPAAAAFTFLHGAGNGPLTVAEGTSPIALVGPAGYGLRTGPLSAPARVAQAGAPLAFGLLRRARPPTSTLNDPPWRTAPVIASTNAARSPAGTASIARFAGSARRL